MATSVMLYHPIQAKGVFGNKSAFTTALFELKRVVNNGDASNGISGDGAAAWSAVLAGACTEYSEVTKTGTEVKGYTPWEKRLGSSGWGGWGCR